MNCTNLFELQLEPQQYTSLQTISIIDSKIDFSKLGVLVNQSPNLKSLAIFSHSDNNQIALKENEINNFLTVKEFPKLNELIIDNMDNISVLVIELIKRSPNLKTLCINNCEHLQGFAALVETDTNYLKNLVSLEIKSDVQHSFADQLTKKLNEWKLRLDNLPATKGLLAMKKLFQIQENNIANNSVVSNFHQNIALFYELKMLAEERLAGTDITQLYYKIRMFTPGRTSDSQRFYKEITSCDLHKIVSLEKFPQSALQIIPH